MENVRLQRKDILVLVAVDKYLGLLLLLRNGAFHHLLKYDDVDLHIYPMLTGESCETICISTGFTFINIFLKGKS